MARQLDSILVVDVGSTCWEETPPDGQEMEIIEIGLCTIDIATLQRIEKRAIFVKRERSEVSTFCTDLTTITPDLVKDAGTFQDALRILRREYASKNRLWASWGDYDRRQFEHQCQARNVGYPFGPSHMNVKSMCAIAVGHDHEQGMDSACRGLGVEVEGTHNRGIDDAWNIAGIICRLMAVLREGMPAY